MRIQERKKKENHSIILLNKKWIKCTFQWWIIRSNVYIFLFHNVCWLELECIQSQCALINNNTPSWEKNRTILRKNHYMNKWIMHHQNTSNIALIGHQNMITLILVIGSRCVCFGCLALTFDFDIVLLSKFIDFDAFLRQQFMFGCNQFVQLFFGIVQLWQDLLDCTLAKHAANQTKAFAIFIDCLQCVYHCSEIRQRKESRKDMRIMITNRISSRWDG